MSHREAVNTRKQISIERNGANVIAPHERKGVARDLFWPWCAANISVLGASYGSFFLGFGISFVQASVAAIIGTTFSFFLVGLVSLAGKRGSAPTMVLTRASFGVKGGKVPTALSYLLLVGWETVLCSLAVLATATVFARVGGLSATSAKFLGFGLVLALTIGGGVLGFDAIMRLQSWITIATIVLTAGYVLLTIKDIKIDTVMSVRSGSAAAFIGALVFGLVGFGLGWLNSGADYSRYLPRSTSSKAVVGWTMFGASIAPILLVVFGALLAASDKDLNSKIAADPIGALTTLLPTWYLIPFAIVAILGLVGGSVLALYSSGLALISIGIKIPRAMAAGIDGVIMIIGTIYVVWIASNFFGPFQGFLITLGVPLAAWGGIFIADVVLRKSEYRDEDLYRANGIYGSTNTKSMMIFAIGSVVGWGLVTNTFASWLSWQGFLLAAFGLGGKQGAWAYANLGVLVALAIGFVGYYFSAKSVIAKQEQNH